ncbi:MAG: type VI secretion system protein [Pirellulaceae bacterium]|jgi:hypothetical protein|nr:type VI secretion system protein [Pirellulaceae bacterium]
MNATAPAPKKPGRWNWLTAPARWSLPARVAALTAAALAVMVITAWLIFLIDPNSVPWRHAMTWWRVLLAVALVVVIPIVVYRGLRLWLEGERSRFPDIDYAWKAGLEALADHGISLDSAPLFVVLGSAGLAQERAIFESSGLGFRVLQAPAGPAPLHWYANPDAIYVVCTEVGWLSALVTMKAQRGNSAEAMPPQFEPAEAPASPEPAANAVPAGSADAGGTLMLDQFVTPRGSPQAAPAAPVAVRRQPAPTVSASVSLRGSGLAEPAALSSRDSAEQLERLQYVCRLIQRVRQPVCSANGVLTLVPFAFLQAAPAEVEQLHRALKNDMTTLRQTLQLRMPTIAMITGMEDEPGFRELVRRVGRERAALQRFGHKFDVRRYATREELTALSAHVCGTFEDWIYALFRERDALSHPGNTRLYGLLCKVRCHVGMRLGDVLSQGFGYDPQHQSDEERAFFSGCYFAATGETSDRQAFVRGVLDKLADENELVEWTESARRDHRRYRRWAAVGYTLAAVLLTGTIGMVLARQWL